MAKKNEKNQTPATPVAPETEDVNVENVYEKIDEQATASMEAAKLAFENMAKEKTEAEAKKIKFVVYKAQWINLKSVCGMRKYRGYSKLMKEFATKTLEMSKKVSGDPANNVAPSMNETQYNNEIKKVRDDLNKRLKEIDDEYNEKVRQIRHSFQELGVWDIDYDFDPGTNNRYNW